MCAALLLVPLLPLLTPRQAGYVPYTPSMLIQFARDAAQRQLHRGAEQQRAILLDDVRAQRHYDCVEGRARRTVPKALQRAELLHQDGQLALDRQSARDREYEGRKEPNRTKGQRRDKLGLFPSESGGRPQRQHSTSGNECMPATYSRDGDGDKPS